MELISKNIVVDDFIGGEAEFLLTKEEQIDEQRIMEKVRIAALDVLFGKNIRALHDLDYKRDIKLEDGRKLVNAWCKNLELLNEDTGECIATYQFSKIEEENKEDFE